MIESNLAQSSAIINKWNFFWMGSENLPHCLDHRSIHFQRSWYSDH